MCQVLPRFSAFLFAIAVFFTSLNSQAAVSADGLYAVFETTKGTFTCALYYDKVPRTVANFVGLAEGSREWLSYREGNIVKRKFYDGLFFHRAIKGFMIQGGSPSSFGDDDPGYRFLNETRPDLLHGKPGILSMANSGGTNSNGSQFFVTVTNTPWLDGKHTVFGEVVEGMDVVYAISMVPVNAEDRPLEPVRMNSVVILRIGAAASAFNPAEVTPALPGIRAKASAVTQEASGLVLRWQQAAKQAYRICYTENFGSWDGGYLGTYTGTTLEDVQAQFAYQFFRVFETDFE